MMIQSSNGRAKSKDKLSAYIQRQTALVAFHEMRVLRLEASLCPARPYCDSAIDAKSCSVSHRRCRYPHRNTTSFSPRDMGQNESRSAFGAEEPRRPRRCRCGQETDQVQLTACIVTFAVREGPHPIDMRRSCLMMGAPDPILRSDLF